MNGVHYTDTATDRIREIVPYNTLQHSRHTHSVSLTREAFNISIVAHPRLTIHSL